MLCACSPYTGCSAETTKTFAKGHDSKLRSRLVAALVSGEPLTRTNPDGSEEVVDPLQVAEEFGLTSYILYFAEQTLAKNRVRQERSEAVADRRTAVSSRRRDALAIRAERERQREHARHLADLARAKLVAEAEASTARYLEGFTWGDGTPLLN